jgi:hypothetical protein
MVTIQTPVDREIEGVTTAFFGDVYGVVWRRNGKEVSNR